MAQKFKFKLERVLAFRKQLEEQAQMALAAATRDYRRQVERVENLKQAFALAEQELMAKKSLSQADFWLWENYKHGMQHNIALAEKKLNDLAQHLAKCRAEAMHKSKDKKLLEILKEKQAGRYEQEQRQKEQIQFDEMATLRFEHQSF